MIIIRFSFTHKTASMFGHKALKAISERNSLAYFSPNNQPPNHTDAREYICPSSDGTVMPWP